MERNQLQLFMTEVPSKFDLVLPRINLNDNEYVRENKRYRSTRLKDIIRKEEN